jgi:protein O-mannosyl-transferase
LDGYAEGIAREGPMKPKRPKLCPGVERVAPAEDSTLVGKAAPGWAHAAVLLVVLLSNLALYHGTFGLGFLSVDDPDYVQNNPYIESFHATNLKHILTTPYSANYAPLNLLSYALDVALAKGKSAAAIHLSNVLWHGFVACTVYLLAFTIRPRILTASAAALLFLLHPAHVEVVAWISSRKDLVATSFAAFSMAAYLRYRRRTRRRWWWYAGSVLAFLLASAGKQSVLLLPAVMLVWDFLVERRRSWQMLADKVPFGLVTLFFGWMTWHAQPSTNQALHPFVLAATEITNLWLLTGLGQYVLYRPAPSAAAWSQIARLALIGGAVLVWALPLLLQRARQPVRAALCYWVLIQMVPPMLLGFIVPITDRYLFLPSVGVCLLLADLAVGLQGKLARARWLPWTLLVILGTVWGAKTWNYVAEWRDPRAVWYGAHLKTPSSQVRQFLGEVYQNAGDRVSNFVKSGTPLQLTNEFPFAEAVLTDSAALERLRAEWTGVTPTRTNSIAYRDQLWDFAWQRFEESVARRGTLSAPNLFMCRGRLLVSQGKFALAIPEFQKALALAQSSNYAVIRNEGTAHALFAIGVAYWSMSNYVEAQQWLLKAQAVQRKSGQVWLPALDQEVERIKRLAAGK